MVSSSDLSDAIEQLKNLLDDAELVIYGGRHLDMFPETTKGLL